MMAKTWRKISFAPDLVTRMTRAVERRMASEVANDGRIDPLAIVIDVLHEMRTPSREIIEAGAASADKYVTWLEVANDVWCTAIERGNFSRNGTAT